MRESLEELETKLNALDQKQRIMLYVMVPLVVIGLVYYFYIDPTLQQIDSSKEKVVQVEKKIKKNAPRNFFRKIKKVKNDILKTKTQIAKLKEDLIVVGTRLDKMNFLFANQKGFNIFLENMLHDSVKNHFLIESLSIDAQHEDFIGVIEKQKKVHVKGYGEFLDTIRFVRQIENNRLLMAIKDFSIETNGTIPFVEFSIDFFGVKR